MKNEVRARLERELADWRRRLEELRLKANLGAKELRQREREAFDAFEPAYEAAMKKLGEAKEVAGVEAKAARAGLEAGWRELRRVWEETRKAKG